MHLNVGYFQHHRSVSFSLVSFSSLLISNTRFAAGMPRETAHLSAAMSGKFVYMEYLSALLAFLVMATVSVGSHLHQPPMIAWAVTIGMQVVFGGLGTVFMTWVMSAHPNSQIPWSMGFFWVVTGKQRERSTRLGEICAGLAERNTVSLARSMSLLCLGRPVQPRWTSSTRERRQGSFWRRRCLTRARVE